MLTQDDLKAIGTIIGQQIDAKVPPMIEAGIKGLVPPMIKAGLLDLEGRVDTKFESFEERMNVKFDAIHEDIESIRNQMVTKSYLDDKLAHYVKKPF